MKISVASGLPWSRATAASSTPPPVGSDTLPARPLDRYVPTTLALEPAVVPQAPSFLSPAQPVVPTRLFQETPPPSTSQPPVAGRKFHVDLTHGDVRVDWYHWTQERDNPGVLAHLQAENAHTEAMMEPTRELQTQLFDEMKSRLSENDQSVPAAAGLYQYYEKTVEGQQYPVHCRRLGEDGPEQVILDLNEMAQDSEFLKLSTLKISPDQPGMVRGRK